MGWYKDHKEDLIEIKKDVLKIINFTHYQITIKKPWLATVIIYFLISFIVFFVIFLSIKSTPLDIKEIYLTPQHEKNVTINGTYLYSLTIELKEKHDITILLWAAPLNLDKRNVPNVYINESKTKYLVNKDKKIEKPLILDTTNSEDGSYAICIKLIDNAKSSQGKPQKFQINCQNQINVAEKGG